MNNSFYALVLRMKYIDRWGLMRNTFSDNLAEHSLDTAILAHALCLIGNEYFGKSLDPERAAVLALFHDAGEIITGDMPTPIKYRSQAPPGPLPGGGGRRRRGPSPPAYRDRLRPHYWSVFAVEDSPLRPYVKAADKLSAYIKCLQETQSGNGSSPMPWPARKRPSGSCICRRWTSSSKTASRPSPRTWTSSKDSPAPGKRKTARNASFVPRGFFLFRLSAFP